MNKQTNWPRKITRVLKRAKKYPNQLTHEELQLLRVINQVQSEQDKKSNQ